MLTILLLLACSGSPTQPPDVQPAPTERPSDVIVITLDTTRADHLGTYGYYRETSPRLDRFAATSLVFDRFIVPMATTLPTHMSLWTGVWPTEHGIEANVMHGGKAFVPSPGLSSLAQILQDKGYATGAFVSAAPLDDQSGALEGFGHHTQPKRYERPAEQTTDDALAWLGEQDGPMLMWVHYYDPHNPFRAPEAYTDLFDPNDARVSTWMTERNISPVAKRPTGQKVRAKPSIHGYDAEIRYMDDQFGRLLEGLEMSGRLGNALVVVMGDHGEGLNQHDQPAHGLVWNEQLHAPLFIKAPGVLPERVDAITSAADVFPTALALVDLPGEASFLKQVSGRDVRATTDKRPVLSQTSRRQLEFGQPLTYALTGERYKCTMVEGQPAVLFDLETDPFELAPISESPELTACQAELTQTLEAQRARAKALGSGQTTDVDADRMDELRELGYLDDEPAN